MNTALEETYQELSKTAAFRGIDEPVGSKGFSAAGATPTRKGDASMSQPARRKMTLEQEKTLYAVRTTSVETLANKADIDTLQENLDAAMEGLSSERAPLGVKLSLPEIFVAEARESAHEPALPMGWRATDKVLREASAQVAQAHTCTGSQPLVVSQVLGNYKQNVPVDAFVRRVRPRPQRVPRQQRRPLDDDEDWRSNFALEGVLAPLEGSISL